MSFIGKKPIGLAIKN